MQENEFIVEKIIDMRQQLNRIQYLVKWEGYPDEENTWEYRENLIKTCFELIEDYHKNCFFEDHKKYITEMRETRGKLKRDQPFCMLKRNENLILVTFYPKKGQFVGSKLIKLSRLPQRLLNYISNYTAAEGEYNNEEIGCIVRFEEDFSLVILLKDKRPVNVQNTILIQNYPQMVIDYLEKLVWKQAQ